MLAPAPEPYDAAEEEDGAGHSSEEEKLSRLDLAAGHRQAVLGDGLRADAEQELWSIE